VSAQPTQKREVKTGGHTKEGENQPNVSPSVLEPDIQWGVILIPNRDRAISAKGGIGGIIQVSAEVLNEIVGPSRACLAQRWVEDGELFWVAGDLEAAGNRGEVVRETVPFSQMEERLTGVLWRASRR